MLDTLSADCQCAVCRDELQLGTTVTPICPPLAPHDPKAGVEGAAWSQPAPELNSFCCESEEMIWFGPRSCRRSYPIPFHARVSPPLVAPPALLSGLTRRRRTHHRYK